MTWLMRPTRLLGAIAFALEPAVAEVAVALRVRLRGFVSAAVAIFSLPCVQLLRV
jgi:hypothetical protein